MSADSTSTIGALMHPTETMWTPEFVENEDVSGRTDLSFSPSIAFHESRSLQLPMLPKMVPNSINDTFPHNLLTIGSKCTVRLFLWSKYRAAYYRCFNVDPNGVGASVWMAATVRKELWSVTASGVRLRTYMVEIEGHASVLNLQVVPFFGEMWTEGWPPRQAIGMYEEPVMQALRVFIAIPTITNFGKLTRQPVTYCAMIVCCDRVKHIKRGFVTEGPYKTCTLFLQQTLPGNEENRLALKKKGCMFYDEDKHDRHQRLPGVVISGTIIDQSLRDSISSWLRCKTSRDQ